MDEEVETFRRIVESKSIGMEEIKVDAYRRADIYGMEVRAELDSRIARQVADHSVTRLANEAGIPRDELFDFIKFLYNDHEIRDRYIAYKTARRLRGDRV